MLCLEIKRVQLVTLFFTMNEELDLVAEKFIECSFTHLLCSPEASKSLCDLFELLRGLFVIHSMSLWDSRKIFSGEPIILES